MLDEYQPVLTTFSSCAENSLFTMKIQKFHQNIFRYCFSFAQFLCAATGYSSSQESFTPLFPDACSAHLFFSSPGRPIFCRMNFCLLPFAPVLFFLVNFFFFLSSEFWEIVERSLSSYCYFS